MSPIKLTEELEVTLLELSEGEPVSAARRAELISALGGEEALNRALEEAHQSQALAQRLTRSSPHPSPDFAATLLSQSRPRRRLTRVPSARPYMELWLLGFVIATLLIVWLAFSAHQRAQRLKLEGELRLIPVQSSP